jgi:hypothetical protein
VLAVAPGLSARGPRRRPQPRRAAPAIREINAGLERFRELFARYGAVEQYAEDELVRRLEEMRESVRRKYEVGPTLDEQLAEAVRAEDYERAARIRDQIRAGG